MPEPGLIETYRGLPTFIPYTDWERDLFRWLEPVEGNLLGYVITGGMTDNMYRQFKHQTILNECGDCKGNRKDCPYNKWRITYKVDHKHQEIVLGYCRCDQAENVQNLLHAKYLASGLPARYWRFQSEDYQKDGNEAVLKAITEALNNNKSIYIYGKVGTGKTLGVAMLGRTVQARKKTVKFYTVAGLLTKMKEGLTAGSNADTGDQVSAIHKACKESDLLILDDLGAEQATSWAIEQLFLILNDRYNDERPTAITSNLSLDALEAKWSKHGVSAERLLSRLSEFITAKTSNKSYR